MTPKQRLRRLSAGLALVLAAGLGYAGWVHLTHLALPCPFHAVTGLWCPGCGVTRMCLALLRLDISAAWQANAVLLVLLPFLGLLLAYRGVVYVRRGSCHTAAWDNILLSTMIVVLLIWGIVRNVI